MYTHLEREASGAHRVGRHSEAVRLACAALDQLFARRAEIVLRIVLHSTSCPIDSVRLLRKESGLVNLPLKSSFSEGESTSFIRYLHDVKSALPPMTTWESLYVAFRSWSIAISHSRRSLPLKRISLSILHRFRQYFLNHMPEWQTYKAALVPALGALVHEPQGYAERLLYRHLFYYEYNYAKRVQLQSHGEQAFCGRSVHWPERLSYLDYIQRNPGSRVLVTIHMGDFMGALKHIADEADPGRSVISLRRSRAESNTNSVLPNDNIANRTLYHGEHETLEIVSALRKGHQTLCAFFDLREDYGECTTVRFFGGQAKMVKGPAQIAIASRVPILPFVTFEHDRMDVIEMEEIIDTRLLPTESFDEGARRITQKLVTLAEKWIRRSPEQWKYLLSVFDYFETTEQNRQ